MPPKSNKVSRSYEASNIDYDNQTAEALAANEAFVGGFTPITVQASIDRMLEVLTDISDTIDLLTDGSFVVGEYRSFAMSTPPTHWLECNGAELSRATYSLLFAAIGTTYGAGDGTTTFLIPDRRAAFGIGWDNGKGIDVDREFGTIQADVLPAHTHEIDVPVSVESDIIINANDDWTTQTTLRNQHPDDSNTIETQTSTYTVTGTGSAVGTSDSTGTGTRVVPRNISELICIRYE